MKKLRKLLALTLVLMLTLSCAVTAGADGTVEAVVTGMSFEVDGVAKDISIYNIDNYNYFKLRDIAALCDGTSKEFSVGYSEGVITLTTGGDYTVGANDLQPASGGNQVGTVSTAPVTVDGRAAALTAYNINGYTYYKLRELCEALGITVTWNAETQTSGISTSGALSLSLKYSGGGHTDDNLGLWYVQELASTPSPCGDVDGDGKMEIIFTVRDIFCLDAETGAIEWMTPYGHDVTETDVKNEAISYQYVPTQITDLDGDGENEIVTIGINVNTKKGYLGIYNGSGEFAVPLITTPYPIRAMEIEDLDHDGRQEITVLLGVGEDYRYTKDPALYVYNSDGSLRAGFPQDFAYGTYGNSIEAVNIDGDSELELVMLGDHEYLGAFNIDGTKVVIEGGPYDGKTWDEIIDFESYDLTRDSVTNNGQWFWTYSEQYKDSYGRCYSVMGSRSGIDAVDVDGDGTLELVITTLISDLKLSGDVMAEGEMSVENAKRIIKYFTTFILELDHSRYVNEELGFDWTAWPQDVGEIITYDDFSVLANPDITPVVADLDGDGLMEILYSSYDGMLHCFSLDGTEHDAWPFDLNTNSDVRTMASKPAVYDLDGDGRQEVVFTTYTEMDQMDARGRIYVVDCEGNVLFEQELPQGWGKGDGDNEYGYPNGGEAMPVIADVDGDGRVEIIATTRSCGVCVYTVN